MSYNNESNKWSMGVEAIKVDLKRAIWGGMISFAVIGIGGWMVGSATGYEAIKLIKLILPSTRSFSSTLLLALGNILALMLTLLSLSASMDIDIKWEHYQRVKQIAWTVTVVLIVTTFAYLLMNIPVTESDNSTISWLPYLYYGILVFSSLLGGAFITIILLLYNTIRDMINVLDPKNEHRLRHTPDEEEE